MIHQGTKSGWGESHLLISTYTQEYHGGDPQINQFSYMLVTVFKGLMKKESKTFGDREVR